MAFLSLKGTGLGNALQSLREHLSHSHKRKLALLSGLIFVSAVLDVFGLASIIPVISAATDPGSIHESAVLDALFRFTGFEQENAFLLFLITCLLMLFVIKSAYGILVNYLQCRLAANIAIDLSEVQFTKFFVLPYYEFRKLKTADIQRDIVSNAGSYVQWIVFSVITLIAEGMVVLLIVGGIALFNIYLFLFITVTVVPATLLITRLIRRYNTHTGLEIDRNWPLAMGAVGQALNGYIDIKLAQREDHYKKEFLVYQRKLQWNIVKHLLMNMIPFRTNEIIAMLGVVIIFLYALVVTGGNHQIVTLIGLFAAASYRMMPSVNRIINALNFININQVVIDNLNNNLHYLKAHVRQAPEQVPVPFEHDIEMRDIVFRFPDADHPVLDGLSLRVAKGEKVGFVGRSGSGKTTLMNILLRFYTEQSGSLLVDGVALTDHHVSDWHRKIGYVKQDIFLLDGTIADNIALGEDDPDAGRLRQAVVQASLAEWVDSLPQGVYTPVGEHGARLSGGQKQRIGIARALYRDAGIIVFDEATSALDSKTEKEVTDAIDRLSSSSRTVFIIAHRITTLKSCQRIYELRDGRVAGTHTYEDLIARTI